jgi:DNA-binding HxlR family transcriptional regulator
LAEGFDPLSRVQPFSQALGLTPLSRSSPLAQRRAAKLSLQRDLGLSRKVLAARLDDLVEAGVLERRAYSEHPPRYDYVPTEMGADLYPVILAVMAWGDRWTAGSEGPPARVRHAACGHLARPTVTCDHCGEPLTAADIAAEAGPGGHTGRGTMVLGPLLAGHTT